MTVKELIKKLRSLDKHSEVYALSDIDGEFVDWYPISNIESDPRGRRVFLGTEKVIDNG